MSSSPVGVGPSNVAAFASNLGAQIESSWHRHNYKRSAFPTVAAECLRATPPQFAFTFENLAESVVLGGSPPYQENFESKFGEPPVTLWWHPKFYIEALCWVTATPAIHNHGFAGAFCVFLGSSVQATYQFLCDDPPLADGFRVGRLELRSVDLLQRGDVQEIHPGDSFVHSVFHLEAPSITLLVRTHSENTGEGGLAYLPPAVEYDAAANEQAASRRLQMLALLARTTYPEYVRLAKESIVHGDALTSFLVLHQAFLFGSVGAGFDSLKDAAVDRWRTSAGPILASAVESRRRMAGAQLRTRIVDPNVRLLLALLLALPDWSAIRTTLLRMRPSVRPSQFVSKCVQVFGQQRAIPFEMDSRATNVMVDILDGAADKVSDELHTYWAARFQSAELLTPLFRHD